MVWAKGQSGNPAGGKSEGKLWQEALKRSLKKVIDANRIDYTGLDAVADAVVNAAISGDMIAAKEIGERLDGKSTNFLVLENRTPFDDMPLNELTSRERELVERIERLTIISLPSPRTSETGSL